MASFAELLGGQSLGRLEDAGYKSPKSEREGGGVSFVPARRGHTAHSTGGAARQASAGSRESASQSPAPVAESAPRRVRGVRPQAWRVTSGYSSHSRVGEVVAKKQRNDLGYAAVAEINCRRYCEGGENWYRLTQLALDGDVSPLVERGYLSQADADNCEPLEAAARAFANAHFTPDMRGGRAVEELGEDAPTWEKLRLAYLIACAPVGGWRLAAPEEARACIHYSAYRSSSFRTFANKKFRDESGAYVSWLCERRYVPSGVDGVVVDRLLYQVDACVETAWSAGGGIFGRVVTPAGGFALSTRSDILGVAQATFSLHLIISKASIHGGYTVGGGDDDSDTWKVFKHPYAPTSVYEKGVDGQDAPIRAAGSADEAVALAVAGFPERGLGVFAPEVMNADGDFVMVYHKPLELDDKFLSVNRVGE